MKQMGYQVVDMLVEHFKLIDKKPVVTIQDKNTLDSILNEPLPQTGAEFNNILEKLRRDVLSNISHINHPRNFAYIPSTPNYIGALAELLSAAYNPITAYWQESCGPSEIEVITINWLKKLFDFPECAFGLFVSGGSTANLTSIVTARETKLGENWIKGTAYYSDQSHSSIEKALKILGFNKNQLRKINSDSTFKININELKHTIQTDLECGLIPFYVVGNVGTTNTGSTDPLEEIAEVCTNHNLWFHIDGAYGAAGILSPKMKEHLKGMHKADSLTFDPHKWFYQPYECACLIVKEPDTLKNSFALLPEYFEDIGNNQNDINFCDYGIQLSRRFNALKLWMSFKYYGLSVFEQMVESTIEKAEFAEDLIKQSTHYKVITPAQLGVLTFRYHDRNKSLDTLNKIQKEIVQTILNEGEFALATTKLNNMVVMRICTSNPLTLSSDLVALINKLEVIAGKNKQKLNISDQTPYRPHGVLH